MSIGMESNNNCINFKNKNNANGKSKKENNNNDKHVRIKLKFGSLINSVELIPPIVAILCYLNSLNGEFVHDDIYAIKRNQDVTGGKPLLELFYNDFWGTSMISYKSHKSYRPLTVLTFRLNYWLLGREPFYFHIVNVFLHSVVTYMFGHVCRHVFRKTRTASLLAGLLFAGHPIHTEAVSGIVGRAELLSCFFFLVSFICYIRCLVSHKTSGVLHVARPWLFFICLLSSAAAMLCKESGVTILGVCLAYDVLVLSRKEILRTETVSQVAGVLKIYSAFIFRVVKTKSLSPACFPLARRVLIVIVFLVVLLSLRLWVMGGTLPIFLRQDNPASFSESFQTRFLTYSFLWAYNGWLLINPSTLCYDWQGGSIELVESLCDHRNLATIMALALVFFLGYVSYMKLKRTTDNVPDPVLVSLILIVLPFLPASNLFFRVGFVLAERVLYIPRYTLC